MGWASPAPVVSNLDSELGGSAADPDSKPDLRSGCMGKLA